jgi:hypothetical protein
MTVMDCTEDYQRTRIPTTEEVIYMNVTGGLGFDPISKRQISGNDNIFGLLGHLAAMEERVLGADSLVRQLEAIEGSTYGSEIRDTFLPSERYFKLASRWDSGAYPPLKKDEVWTDYVARALVAAPEKPVPSRERNEIYFARDF